MKWLFFLPFLIFGSVKETLQEFKKKEGICGIATTLVYPKKDKLEASTIVLGEIGRHTKVSIKEDTLFRLGKATQIFTAQLARKYFKCEEELEKVLPRNTSIPKRNAHCVSLQHLLNHTSGLQTAMPASYNRKTASQATMLSNIRRGRLAANPGTRHCELDLNYALLSLAIAHHKLERFSDLLKNQILNEYPRVKFDLSLSERQRMASGHKGFKREVIEGDPAYSPYAAATGLYGSIEDLSMWLQKVAANPELLPPKVTLGLNAVADCFLVENLTPTMSLSTYILSDRYLGYSIFLAYVPVTKCGIAMLANSDCGVERMGREILAVMCSGNFDL